VFDDWVASEPGRCCGARCQSARGEALRATRSQRARAYRDGCWRRAGTRTPRAGTPRARGKPGSQPRPERAGDEVILDLQTTFSVTPAADGTKTGQAITATAISANVIDLRPTLGAFGAVGAPSLVDDGLFADDLWLVAQCDQSADFAAAGAATLTITLESDT